jgi:hypothetical protein
LNERILSYKRVLRSKGFAEKHQKIKSLRVAVHKIREVSQDEGLLNREINKKTEMFKYNQVDTTGHN